MQSFEFLRYLNPPNFWVTAALESRELMALCLKKLKNLSKVKLIDAIFVWTEPHSKRIKVSPNSAKAQWNVSHDFACKTYNCAIFM